MYKIAALGDRESVLAYKAFGIQTYPVMDSAEAAAMIKKLAEEEYAIIFLTEQIAVEIPELISKYSSRVAPAIIMIPGSKGSLGIGMNEISTVVEKAVGADILAGKDKKKASSDVERMDK